MPAELTFECEKHAAEAGNLSAFDGLNLVGIKRDLEKLLGLIGRGDIFDQYTSHDISHVDATLKNIDWLVPEATKEIMTPTDWLLTVLSVYFHDLGMLVTKKEYEARDASEFPRFRDDVLFGGEHGDDYRNKVEQISQEDRERFLYQEFVRENHAKRIRRWIEGQSFDSIGASTDIAKLVETILAPLDEGFRQGPGTRL